MKKYTIVLQFPSSALSVAGNMGIISACIVRHPYDKSVAKIINYPKCGGRLFIFRSTKLFINATVSSIPNTETSIEKL